MKVKRWKCRNLIRIIPSQETTRKPVEHQNGVGDMPKKFSRSHRLHEISDNTRTSSKPCKRSLGTDLTRQKWRRSKINNLLQQSQRHQRQTHSLHLWAAVPKLRAIMSSNRCMKATSRTSWWYHHCKTESRCTCNPFSHHRRNSPCQDQTLAPIMITKLPNS